jgi:PHD/YefM family antitoxin component YafN of YafNO toxin-antitoxin module
MGTRPNKFVVDERGKKMGIIIPVARYEKLLEDLHDLAVIAERRRETSVSIEEMRRRLRAHGLL